MEIWRFSERGVPPNHPLKSGMFHSKPSILGTPIDETSCACIHNIYVYHISYKIYIAQPTDDYCIQLFKRNCLAHQNRKTWDILDIVG